MIYTHNLGVNNIFISRGEKLLFCTKHEFTGERVADLEPDITHYNYRVFRIIRTR
ncbi:MAG: hypothetical protein JXA95_11200 [Spirochaetales bacterium]|nr:hypothetical protein [Spirochaetales bacterium]